MANVEESGGDVEHLLVVIVDLCNAYEISASSKEHTQAVRQLSWIVFKLYKVL